MYCKKFFLSIFHNWISDKYMSYFDYAIEQTTNNNTVDYIHVHVCLLKVGRKYILRVFC